jgi:hypothetical protein
LTGQHLHQGIDEDAAADQKQRSRDRLCAASFDQGTTSATERQRLRANSQLYGCISSNQGRGCALIS